MTIQSASGASSTSDYIITQVAVKAIDGGMPVTLAGIIAPIIESSVKSAEKRTEEGGLGSFSGHLLDDPGKAKLAMMLKPFFRRYDANNDGHMNVIELRSILTDLGEEVSANEAKDWMRRLDPDNTDSIEMDQFTDAMLNYIKEKTKQHLATPGHKTAQPPHLDTFPERSMRRTTRGRARVVGARSRCGPGWSRRRSWASRSLRPHGAWGHGSCVGWQLVAWRGRGACGRAGRGGSASYWRSVSGSRLWLSRSALLKRYLENQSVWILHWVGLLS